MPTGAKLFLHLGHHRHGIHQCLALHEEQASGGSFIDRGNHSWLQCSQRNPWSATGFAFFHWFVSSIGPLPIWPTEPRPSESQIGTLFEISR